MHGQVASNLFKYADVRADLLEGRTSKQHYWTWRKGVERVHPAARIDSFQDVKHIFEIERENRADPALQRTARLFLRGVGTKRWESVFGRWWDESLRLAEREEES